ncbi:hypothetical protein A2U01_0025160 [Trifolium medium]|uniref:Transmembrane protein n=1 Tax=Trifolium medium TaxID=97028 RepID=A0A392NYE3_9FABA|nr:hypothetical protein [Trifolium medium]
MTVDTVLAVAMQMTTGEVAYMAMDVCMFYWFLMNKWWIERKWFVAILLYGGGVRLVGDEGGGVLSSSLFFGYECGGF